MARPKHIMRPILKRVSIPEDIVARVDLELYSEVEQKVPYGAWSELCERLLREHLNKQVRALVAAS